MRYVVNRKANEADVEEWLERKWEKEEGEKVSKQLKEVKKQL